MSRHDCPLQIGQNDFDDRKTRSQGYFMMVTGERDTSIWVCLGAHLYVKYSADDEHTLARLLRWRKLSSIEHQYLLDVVTVSLLAGDGNSIMGYRPTPT